MATLLGKFIKQPGETLDYEVDFTEWFSNRIDEPLSHTVIVEPGLTLVGSTRVGADVKIVIAGGQAGGQYKVTVRMQTSEGLVKEADFQIRVREV